MKNGISATKKIPDNESSHTIVNGLMDRSRRPSSVVSNTSCISDLQTLITKRDVKSTMDNMSHLLKSTNKFAQSLMEVSESASGMATAIENMAKLKGCNDDTAEKLLNASGLFHLLGNHEQILSTYVNELLCDKLQDEIDEFKINSKKSENEFKMNSKEQSLKLKLQERNNMKLAKRKIRNLISYRESLSNLQNQLDQLETLKYDYYRDSYLLVDKTCNHVLTNIATVSRTQVELSENIARKGWSGGGLDELLIDAEDPFTKDNDEGETVTENNDLVEEEEEEEEDGEEDVEAVSYTHLPLTTIQGFFNKIAN